MCFFMGKDIVVYANNANNPDQEETNNAVIGGLSGFFDVKFLGVLNDGLVDRLEGEGGKFGLVTHFPYGDSEGSEAGMYVGAARMIRQLRCSRPSLPIVVYTGAGALWAKPDEFIKGLIIGAGADEVVFKYDLTKDVGEIREKMSALLGVD